MYNLKNHKLTKRHKNRLAKRAANQAMENSLNIGISSSQLSIPTQVNNSSKIPISTSRVHSSGQSTLDESASSLDYLHYLGRTRNVPVNHSNSAPNHDNISVTLNNTDKDTDLISKIKSELSNWAIDFKIPHNALTNLLKILKVVPQLSQLPVDSRTLLGIHLRQLPLKDVLPGKYFNFGVKNAVSLLLSKISENLLDKIEICINIDGVPLTKSSGSQFYPILCSLYSNPTEVSVIGIYHGYNKPNDMNDFLYDFVKEASEYVNNGFIYNEKIYPFTVKALICDAPAKSAVKCITGHTGYYSCSKCYIKGAYFDNRIVFPETENFIRRVDFEFRNKINKKHHTGTSILELLPNFDMVGSFVLDYMHLICLGTVRKLLFLWCFDTKSGSKLSRMNLHKISTLLISQSRNIPCEFSRKPRSLVEVKRWKATEFRQFLLYTGPFILKFVLSNNHYRNFLSLFVAIFILTSLKNPENIAVAEILLKYFVKTFKTLYGMRNMSHNIHNMLHICDDVRVMGPLDKFSAFPFENKLQQLKRLVRKGHQPLAQVVKRLYEIEKHSSHLLNIKLKNFKTFREHECGPLPNGTSHPQYMELHFSEFKLKTSQPDNCCILKNGNIIIIKNFVTKIKNVIIIGNRYLDKQDFFDEPCPSSELGIHKISNLSPLLEEFQIEQVINKCVKLTFQNDCVVFPFLHGLN